MTKTILLVEDEAKIAHWVQTYVQKAGYACTWVDNGADALLVARDEHPDLVVLDLMLPEIDGWEVCRRLRESSDVPIIMLTARIAGDDIINGLKMGADDYVTKPFNPAELLARIEANLRRAEGRVAGDGHLAAGPLTLDPDGRQCWLEGEAISLTSHQFNLLEFFMRHPNQVFSREQLIEHVFGLDYDGYARAVDVHISRLRGKIERDPADPALIVTVFGAGYKFVPA
jgi:DNA-binding response OmpR family regulator